MISSLPGKALRMLVDIVKLAKSYRFLYRFSVMDDVIQKVQRHHDLIKAHALR